MSNLLDKKYVDYVIVVHGIGEQRPNETILSVINRFAEARKATALGTGLPPKGAVVSMGKVAAQVGTLPKMVNGTYSFTGMKPWAQFDAIPSNRPAKDPDFPDFIGKRSSGEDDIRFVDFCWSDILSQYYEVSGQDVQQWTDSVISRVQKQQKPDSWVLKVLEQVQETALFAQKVAGLPGVGQSAALNDIMDKYVGDIQIYGENRSVRGRAVLRFHNLMEKLHNQHCNDYNIDPNQQANASMEEQYTSRENNHIHIPRYTIIAHSLGTVLAMDAILYGHIKKTAAYGPTMGKTGKGEREPESLYRDLPFEMYDGHHLWWAKDPDGKTIAESQWVARTNGPCMGSNWIGNINAFVTLGSPIDKYLTLWPENYNFLNGESYYSQVPSGAEHVFQSRIISGDMEMKPIPHFNYCDEQDPVGHHLDLFAQQQAYRLIFTNGENADNDVTFNKYRIPGVAHVKYWEDQELFERILTQTVDSKETGIQIDSGEVFAEKRASLKSYWIVILYTYYLPVLATGVVMGILFNWGWDSMKAGHWKSGLIASLAFCLAAYFFKKLMSLAVWWRQILRKKSTSSHHNYRQNGSSWVFRFILIVGTVKAALLSIYLVPVAIAVQAQHSNADWNFAWQYALLLVLSGLGTFFLAKSSWTRKWSVSTRASKYPESFTVAIAAILAVGAYATIHLYGLPAIAATWPDQISAKWTTPLATIACGLTLAWMYMMMTFFYVKNVLKGW